MDHRREVIVFALPSLSPLPRMDGLTAFTQGAVHGASAQNEGALLGPCGARQGAASQLGDDTQSLWRAVGVPIDRSPAPRLEGAPFNLDLY